MGNLSASIAGFGGRLIQAALSPTSVVSAMEPLFRLSGRRGRVTAPFSVKSAGRIVVIRVDDIGDVVLFSGFLRQLRANCPSAHITLVVSKVSLNLFQRCPLVDSVLAYNCPRQIDVSGGRKMTLRRLAQSWRAFAFAARRLWPLRLDVALVPRFEVDRYYASFLAYFSGAPVRLSYSTSCTDTKAILTEGYDVLFTEVLHSRRAMHEAERATEFLGFLGLAGDAALPELWLSDEDIGFAKDFLQGVDLSGQKVLIAFGIGASLPVRQWPLERVIQTCEGLLRRDFEIVLIGGSTDRTFANAVKRACGGKPILNAVGTCSLRQTAALLKRCCLYVGNDSGPLHLAAAAGLPAVEISSYPKSGTADHYNSPARFGPWNVPRRILQPARPVSPCVCYCKQSHAHCILEVQVEDVLSAVDELFEADRQRQPSLSARGFLAS